MSSVWGLSWAPAQPPPVVTMQLLNSLELHSGHSDTQTNQLLNSLLHGSSLPGISSHEQMQMGDAMVVDPSGDFFGDYDHLEEGDFDLGARCGNEDQDKDDLELDDEDEGYQIPSAVAAVAGVFLPRPAMLSRENYLALKKASDEFIQNQSSGARDIKEVMENARHWTELEVFDEKIRDGDKNAEKPWVILSNIFEQQIPQMPEVNCFNVDMEPEVVNELSNAVLQNTTADHERERQERMENGNDAPWVCSS
ncbi:hypothetical protein DFJ43DRAFT_1036061 [Lentinula guzmanii]|uniref:Uncharacterized protein n=1 Tax=Lentinula guzmanii TaxID=2804957 RepID=A0AA38N5C7_9AGAR|nr:hypothetical protein DFJ43DRAFT_1036061 [Lentinula guzmanii]